jgi:hypothetical protein
LRDGFLVVGFHGVEDDTLVAQTLWFHIGFQLLSPYRPCLHRLEKTDDPEQLPGSDSRVYLSPTSEFYTDFLAIKELSLARMTWSRTLMLLEDTDQAAASVHPNPVPCIQFRADPGSRQIWPRPRAKRSRAEAPSHASRGAASSGSSGAVGAPPIAPLALCDGSAADEDEPVDKPEDDADDVDVAGPIDADAAWMALLSEGGVLAITHLSMVAY